MNAPTTAEIRTWSRLDFAERGYGEGSPDPLEVLIARASDYVMNKTGRTLVTVPTEFETTAQQAIQMRVEQMVVQASDDYAGTVGEDMVKSMGAGSFNESKRDLKEFRDLVNPWPALHDLLWEMMTDDKQAEWLAVIGEQVEPAYEATEVDWFPEYGGDLTGDAWGA